MRRGGSRGGRTRGGGAATHRPAPPTSGPETRRRRESDTSIASSRPSTSTPHRVPQHHNPSLSTAEMLRSVNAYLSSCNATFSLRPPLPSLRDISDAVILVSSRLGHPFPSSSSLEVEMPLLLSFFSCPFKPAKSAFKTPGTPHAWPSFLSALHFLVELARVHDHLDSSPSPFAHGNLLLGYAVDSYAQFIVGDDDAVKALDDKYLALAQQQVDGLLSGINTLEKEVEEKEARVKSARNDLTPKEALEKEKGDLIGDIAKFRRVVETHSGTVAGMEEKLDGKRKELETKEVEFGRICKENEELRMRISMQAVDVEGVERMRRELYSLERDIEEAKASRKELEEKMDQLGFTIPRKRRELEALECECNDAIRKLKLSSDFQYALNFDGSSPSAVLGTKYKSVLKPALKALAGDIKKSQEENLDLSIALQQQLQEKAVILKEKKDYISELQAKVKDATNQSNLIKAGIEDHSSLYESEIKRMLAETEARMHQLEIVEEEAEEFLKNTELNLQEEIKRSDQSIQLCALELLALVDLISNYKEDMESKISTMKSDLSETIKAVAEAHKASFSARLSSIGTDASNLSSKRVRLSSEEL